MTKSTTATGNNQMVVKNQHQATGGDKNCINWQS